MTDEEMAIMNALASVWNLFLKMPMEDASEVTDLCHHIHGAQNIVLARAGLRAIRKARDEARTNPA